MAKYEVGFEVHGTGEYYIQAESEDEAIRLAKEDLHGQELEDNCVSLDVDIIVAFNTEE